MPSKALSLSLLLLFIALSLPNFSQAIERSAQVLRPSEASMAQLSKLTAQEDLQNNVQDDSNDEEDRDENGMLSVVIGVLAAELGDMAFYAALIMSFIYSPVFAILAFGISCLVISLLGAIYVGTILLILPRLLISCIAAVLFVFFSGLTAYLIYSMKDTELATENSIRKKGENTEGEQETFIDYTQEERENFLTADAVVDRQEAKPKSGWRKILSFDLFKNLPFRFLYAAGLLALAQLAGDALRQISEYRGVNSFAKVFFGSLIAFVIAGAAIAGLGFLFKEIAFRKCNLSLDKTRIVKYVACGALVIVGCINVVSDVGENSRT